MPAQLIWGLKQSFLDYVEESGGRVDVSCQAGWVDEPHSGFLFGSADGMTRTHNTVELPFRGRIDVWAHEGSIDFGLSCPRLELDAAKGRLSFLLRLGASPDRPRLQVISFGLDGHHVPDQPGSLHAVPTELDPEGCRIFENLYPAFTPMAPLTLHMESDQI